MLTYWAFFAILNSFSFYGHWTPWPLFLDFLRGGRRTLTSGVQRSTEVMPANNPRLTKQGSKDSNDGSVSSEGSKWVISIRSRDSFLPNMLYLSNLRIFWICLYLVPQTVLASLSLPFNTQPRLCPQYQFFVPEMCDESVFIKYILFLLELPLSVCFNDNNYFNKTFTLHSYSFLMYAITKFGVGILYIL